MSEFSPKAETKDMELVRTMRGVLVQAEGEVPPPRRRVPFVAEQKGQKISLGASAPKYPGVSPETDSLRPARKI